MKRFGIGSKFDKYDHFDDGYGYLKSQKYKKACNKIIRRNERQHIKEELRDCNE